MNKEVQTTVFRVAVVALLAINAWITWTQSEPLNDVSSYAYRISRGDTPTKVQLVDATGTPVHLSSLGASGLDGPLSESAARQAREEMLRTTREGAEEAIEIKMPDLPTHAEADSDES